MPSSVRRLFEDAGLEVPAMPERLLPSFSDQVETVIEVAPAAVGFLFGMPERGLVERLKAAGTAVLGTATTPEEAVALERDGADAVIASGAEAGGHRPSFLRAPEESLIGTFALVPQVVDAVSVPVIAAGGIADGRGVAAARMLGAEGVQVGTAFLATRQSAASAGYRDVLLSERARTTVLTTASSGRLARGVPNRLTATIGGDVGPFPAQNWWTGILRAAAAARDDPEMLALWCGQGAALNRIGNADELFRRLVEDAGRLLSPGSS
jgi:nitronate monooxygenase